MAIRFDNSSFNFMARKHVWFGISGILLIPGIIAIIMCMMQFGTPVRLGIDFTGGSLMQLTFQEPIKADALKDTLSASGHKDAQVQIADQKTALIRTKELGSTERQEVLDVVKAKHGAFVPDRFESVGPTIGKELLTAALSALCVALLGIVGYIGYRYQFDFAICAISALTHDIFFVTGVFAILGLTLGVEVDSMFVPALLTVLGFTIHDTIIIYDRIRENMKTAGKRDTFDDVADRSIKQTLARSINTSLSVCLPLLAMLIFGGETIRWFVFAMLIGIMAGGYSAIFNASQLLSVWRMMGVKRAT